MYICVYVCVYVYVCVCTCTCTCACACTCTCYIQTDIHYITLHYITLHNIHRYIVEKQLGGYAMAPSCQVHAGADQVHEGSGAMVGARAGHWEVCMAPRIPTPDAERGIVDGIDGIKKYWRSLERNHWVVTRFSFLVDVSLVEILLVSQNVVVFLRGSATSPTSGPTASPIPTRMRVSWTGTVRCPNWDVSMWALGQGDGSQDPRISLISHICFNRRIITFKIKKKHIC